MECRVCAEDPENQFFPSPGRIAQLREPSGPGIRLDSGVYPGWTVPLDYDPLLAKLVAWAPDRHTAIQRLHRALGEYAVAGVKTNLAFFREILEDEQFREGRLDTGFVAGLLARRKPSVPPEPMLEVAATLAAVAASKNGKPAVGVESKESSGWRTEGRGRLLR
jgi:acetyl-CoA carboxylase biotin carboxylase subunit